MTTSKSNMPNLWRFLLFFLLLAYLLYACQRRAATTTNITPVASNEKKQINPLLAKAVYAEVLVIGDGTGATASAIQAARSGASTILVTSLPWLGGMLTSAGVSATDGNHLLPAGLWGEFRDSLRNHYGGADSLFTGWVSNTMFEPHIGDYYWKKIAHREKNLSIYYQTTWDTLYYEQQWMVNISKGGHTNTLRGTILVDGTDLGDVAAAARATFDIGMDSRTQTSETMAPNQANDIIQDLTYPAILKDYGDGEDKTIPKPDHYDPSLFYCSCQQDCDTLTSKVHPCDKMLSYGKLPNDKYLINWPLKGNDYYTNIIEKSETERTALLGQAKNKTLQFIYYIQTELGYSHLGIADDEFPTTDGLPLMPYHREGRRIHGLTQLKVHHILQPYKYSLYQSGIAVGDYPIDHHHFERSDAPELDFPKVPSFSIPLGAIIPKGVDNLLIADKAISVTNIVNGSTRLQPVIIQIGQAAGLVAAIAAQTQTSPKAIPIRKIQQAVLEYKGYLLPFIDVPPSHPHFEAVQRIGATGILQGTGIPFKWANQTWFYPDSLITPVILQKGAPPIISTFLKEKKNQPLTIKNAIDIVSEWKKQLQHSSSNLDKTAFLKSIQTNWEKKWKLSNFQLNRPITRLELAVLIDDLIDPFSKEIVPD